MAVQEHASSATLKLLLLLQECSHLLGLSARSNMHRTKQLCARGDMSPNELPLVIAECDGWMDGLHVQLRWLLKHKWTCRCKVQQTWCGSCVVTHMIIGRSRVFKGCKGVVALGTSKACQLTIFIQCYGAPPVQKMQV